MYDNCYDNISANYHGELVCDLGLQQVYSSEEMGLEDIPLKALTGGLFLHDALN